MEPSPPLTRAAAAAKAEETEAHKSAEVSDVEIESTRAASPTHNNHANHNKTGLESSSSTLPSSTVGMSRHKRHRDDMGPTTPRSEDETKVLGGGLTPLAKKGRVLPDKTRASTGQRGGDASIDTTAEDADLEDANEDDANEKLEEEVEAEDDDDDDEDGVGRSTPPRLAPKGLEVGSPPPTPMMTGDQTDKKARLPEGKETKAIRKRVANLEWKDGEQPPPAVNDSDVEIAEVAAEVSESAEMIEGEEAQVADEVNESAKLVAKDDEEKEDKEMAAEEANVAADVAVSAKMLAEGDEAKQDEDEQIAEVASEVATSARKVDAQDAAAVDEAEVAAEVSESSKNVAPETPVAPTPSATATESSLSSSTSSTATTTTPAVKNSFSAFSSSASPFAAVGASGSAASPLGSIAKRSTEVAPFQQPDNPSSSEKPKARSTFGSDAVPLTTSNAASAEVPPYSPPSNDTADSSSFTSTPATVSKPIQTFTKSSATSTLGGGSAFASGASPFSSYASTSGFSAVAATPSSSSSTTTSSSALSSAKPVAVPKSVFGASTASSAAGGFGSFSGASPFASLSAKKPAGSSATGGGDDASTSTTTDASSATPAAPRARKIGEPEEVDESKLVFTEQEVVTGEEEDELIHSVRSKLFVMNDGGWVERGVGLLRLNRTNQVEKNGARLVMRADATHRLLLNATLFSEFSIEVNQEKYVRFAVIENGEPTSYMLRLSGPTTANALVKAVQDEVARL